MSGSMSYVKQEIKALLGIPNKFHTILFIQSLEYPNTLQKATEDS